MFCNTSDKLSRIGSLVGGKMDESNEGEGSKEKIYKFK
jgi:hypothetical protein